MTRQNSLITFENQTTTCLVFRCFMLYNCAYFISAFVSGASAIPAGLPIPGIGDLEGPPTPAGPTPKSKGPVPLMSLTLAPPQTKEARHGLPPASSSAYLPKALEDALAFKAARTSQVRGCT